MSGNRVRMAGIAAALGAVAVLGATTFASGPAITDAGPANTKTAGITLPDKLSPQWREMTVAQGSTALENPSALTSWYGYFNDGPMLPAPGDVQATGHNVEATKSEPDKNTYLVDQGPARRRPEVRLRHALPLPGTRARHRQRRLHHPHQPRRRRGPPRHEAGGDRGRWQSPIPEIDGSTWDPFAQRLLFSTEGGDEGGLTEATLDFPSKVSKLWGVVGQGGYEGIQNDQYGNVYIVEDVGGPAGKVNTHAKQPNSFVYPPAALRPDQPGRGRQAAGAAGRVARASRRDRLRHAAPTRTSSRPTRRTCTPTATSSRRCGSRSMTPRRTARRPSTPTRRPRRPAARRSSAPRTASSSRARASRSSSSPRPATRR